MTIVLAVVAGVFLVLFLIMLFKSQRLQDRAGQQKAEIATLSEQWEANRQHYEAEKNRIHAEAQMAIAGAQQLVDQQLADLKQEAERIRQHYEAEARKSQEAAEALLAKTLQELEPLRKDESLQD